MTDLGVFVDFSSLYQAPRTEAQTKVFLASLKGINLWYAHQLSTVWLVTSDGEPSTAKSRSRSRGRGLRNDYRELSVASATSAASVTSSSGDGALAGAESDAEAEEEEEPAHRDYYSRGWCCFEYALSQMIKASNTSVRTDWPQVVDLGRADMGDQTVFRRPAPAEPLSFYEGHECGELVYTNGADRDGIVAPAFRRTIFSLLGGVRELNYNVRLTHARARARAKGASACMCMWRAPSLPAPASSIRARLGVLLLVHLLTSTFARAEAGLGRRGGVPAGGGAPAVRPAAQARARAELDRRCRACGARGGVEPPR